MNTYKMIKDLEYSVETLRKMRESYDDLTLAGEYIDGQIMAYTKVIEKLKNA